MTTTTENKIPALGLVLPITFVDIIGNALAERPYKEVKDVLDLITMQANDQKLQLALGGAYEKASDPSAEAALPQIQDAGQQL